MIDPIVAFMENYKLSTCSFVRESEVEVGISMADAISEKYLTDEAFENSECQPSSNVDGKKLIGHEFVGRSKAVEFFSQTKNLLMLGLQECRIDRLGDISGFSFPRVRHLYLSNNLIHELSVVSGAISYLPNLETLCVSGNFFTAKCDTFLEAPKLTTVVMNKTLIGFDDVVRMLSKLSNLKSLSLCGNAYSDIGCAPKLRSLQTLDRSHRERLELIHGNRDDSGQSKLTAQNLASRMIRVVLVPDGDSESYTKDQIARQLPSTTSVRDVKSLCSRLFSLELSDIVLVYNDGVGCGYRYSLP